MCFVRAVVSSPVVARPAESARRPSVRRKNNKVKQQIKALKKQTAAKLAASRANA